jgi:ketosteroid isomerase-like protein
MGKSENLAVAEAFLAAVANKDADAMRALMNEDLEWLIVSPTMGSEPQHGTTVADMLCERLRGTFASIDIEIVRAVVDGEAVVIEAHALGEGNKGEKYDNWYIHWFEINNGKVSLWREHLDTKRIFDTFQL